MWAIVVVYIIGRLLIQKVFDLPPIWGGTPASERKAIALVAAFCMSVAAGVYLVPRRRLVRLDFTPRGRIAEHVGAALAASYLAVGLGCALILIKRLGGVSRVMENQAALASQLRELGLTPLYGLTYLFILACIVLAFRALSARRAMRAGIWFLCVLGLSTLLGRRVMILFAALPLLSYLHYHVRRLRWRQVLLLVSCGFALFTGILLLRLGASANSLAETVGTSLEYALYDALVISVDRVDDLKSLDASYFARHPDEFWGSNTGALFLQRLSGFRWTGGATPPTAVGALWVYFGTIGMLCWGCTLGFLLGRLRLEARGSPAGALLYGFVLFFWFDFLRNGDIVLGLKVFLRYAVLLGALLLCFYRVRVVPARTVMAQLGSEGAA